MKEFGLKVCFFLFLVDPLNRISLGRARLVCLSFTRHRLYRSQRYGRRIRRGARDSRCPHDGMAFRSSLGRRV
jgi:hypothetical protein